jgi:integrase
MALNLYKPANSPYWHVRAQINGKPYCESTKETDLKRAKTVRSQLLAAARVAALQDRLGEFALRGRGGTAGGAWASIQQIVDRYEVAARTRGIGQRTMVGYVGSLRTVLRGAGVDVETARANVLTAKTVEDYVTAAIAADGSDSGRRTVASTLLQARALFARWTADVYQGLRIPDLEPFKSAGRIKVPAVRYMLPDPALVARTKEEAAKLTGRLRMAYLLCYHLALRASEVAAVRWSWFRESPTGVVLDIVRREGEGYAPKGRDRSVPVHPDLWKALLELRGAGEYLVDAPSYSERLDVVLRELSAWMVRVGWTTEKKAHELRKLRGSEWYTKLGAEVAQTWLGHMDVSMTCRFYATWTRQPAPLVPDL